MSRPRSTSDGAPGSSPGEHVSPPLLAVWLLTHALPHPVREPFLGDLHESFHDDILPARGARAARRWYWRETLRALLAAPSMHRSLRAAPPPFLAPGRDGPMTTLLSDLRYALRLLARKPAFTLLAVGTLALGIGATTAIFSVVNSILFEPLPYPEADRILTVWQHIEGGDRALAPVTVPATAKFVTWGKDRSADLDLFGSTTYNAITRAVSSFEYTAAVGYETATLTGRTEPELLVGQRVSWTFLRVLGVRPALGRDFTRAEDVPNAAPVVILSHGLWRRRFGADSGIVGRVITLDGAPVTVVGVMPAGFESILQPDAQIWTPLRYDLSIPSYRDLRVIARLGPGATARRADHELDVLYQDLVRQHPDEYAHGNLMVVSLRDQATRDARPVLFAVLGAVLFVLLIACVNVVNLLLAQGAQRRGEFAVRSALGAAHTRLVRQLLTESVLLSAIGGALGIGVAALGVRALIAMSPPGLPLVGAISIDARVLAFALFLTMTVGVAFGLIPALHAARGDLHDDIKASSRRTAGARTTRTMLVVSEVALAFVLLIGSGLLLRSLARLFAVAPGFDTANLLTMQIQTSGPQFATDASTRAYFDRVLAAVRAVPGVESAALTSQLPLSGEFDVYGLHSESHPDVDYRLDPTGFRYTVSDGYLSTMRIPLLRGRAFTEQDRADQVPVALINETLARSTLWGGDNPIGQRVRVGPSNRGPWLTIVGIVADVKQQSLAAAPANAIYLLERQPWRFADAAMSVVVRTMADPAAMTRRLREAIRSVDKDQPITRVATMDDLLARTAAGRRFVLVLFEAFALVALALAAAGIYGVLAGTVAERFREIGVRAALGASRWDILGMVLRQGLALTAFGIVIGIAGALAFSRIITGLLFGISSVDPLTYLGVTGVLGLVALAACWLPAMRATRVDPAVTLRAE
jgi:putative ABC transport system permease protein